MFDNSKTIVCDREEGKVLSYPQDVSFNCAVVGKKIICNKKYITFKTLIDFIMGKILLQNIVVDGMLSDILIEGNKISGISPVDAQTYASMTCAEEVERLDCVGILDEKLNKYPSARWSPCRRSEVILY